MSVDCYLTDRCLKHKNNPDCTEVWCCKKFAIIDKFLSLACLTPNQRKHQTIVLDKDKKDQKAFNELKTEVVDRIGDFVSSGENLFIHSDICGNGKTSWALNIIQAYIDSIWIDSKLTTKALFINVPSFLINLKKNDFHPDEETRYIMDNIKTADLVVWDDIATKYVSEYEAEMLFSYIDARLSMKKSNVYTCNLTESEILDRMGDRLYSRVVKPSRCIELVGKDKRGLKLQ